MCGGESYGMEGWQGRGVERWPVHYMQNRVHHSAPEPSQVAKGEKGERRRRWGPQIGEGRRGRRQCGIARVRGKESEKVSQGRKDRDRDEDGDGRRGGGGRDGGGEEKDGGSHWAVSSCEDLYHGASTRTQTRLTYAKREAHVPLHPNKCHRETKTFLLLSFLAVGPREFAQTRTNDHSGSASRTTPSCLPSFVARSTHRPFPLKRERANHISVTSLVQKHACGGCEPRDSQSGRSAPELAGSSRAR